MSSRLLQSVASRLVLASVLATAAPAAAQTVSATTPPPPDQEAGTTAPDTQQSDVVVTGTRIQRPNLTSTSPLTVVDDTEIRLQGSVNVENTLNRLPQVTAGANENVSNGSNGTATVNLRDLGSNRNLVLINGQRLLPVQAVDINFIPSFLVERIDVVTGGASAVYGSDAISGVINFILRDNLQGIRLDTQYSFAQHQNNNDYARGIVERQNYVKAPRNVLDGQKFDFNIGFGTNFDEGRGNVTAYGGYRHVRPILQSDRDVSACAFDPNAARDALVCGGSINNPFGYFNPLSGPNRGREVNNARDGSKTWVPYNTSFLYNTAPLNYFQRSERRYTGGAFAKYEVTKAAELYGSFMFMDVHTFSQVAPSALFSGTTFTVNCDNPLLAPAQATYLCGAAAGTAASATTLIGYRPVDGSAQPRRNDIRLTDYRFTGGLRGEIAEGIRYDANFLRSIVLRNEVYQNDIDFVRANRGLQVVNRNGTPTCKSVIDGTDSACVPLNVFQYLGISDAAFNYIYVPYFSRGTDKQSVYTGTISADGGSYGIRSPLARDGLAVVLGVEHRRESLDFRADAVAQSKGTRNSAGKFNVTEFFTEVSLPIAQDQSWAESFTVDGGYRRSDYSNLQDAVETYKIGGQLKPIPDILYRASYNRAVRAPNISELFAAQQIGNVSAQDPCAGASPTASFAQCAVTGVTQGQYGFIPQCPATFCSAQGGGNPDLLPERANTYTFGAVATPRFLPRFSVSIDYFNIKVNGYIASPAAALIISRCFSTNNPFFCSLFTRDPRSGALFGEQGYVRSTTQNTGSLATSGFDFGTNYQLRAGRVGSFDFSFVGTLLNESITEPNPGLGSFDCKGLFGPTCGQPAPEWRHQARVTWADPDRVGSLSLNWRFIGGTSLTNNTDDPFLRGPRYAVNAELPDYSYFDLAATAKVMDGIVFRAGVNNLLDKDPPVIAQNLPSAFGNGNTYPGVYDVAGRTIFIGLNAQF